MVPGIDPGAPTALAGFGVLLAAVALAACWIPARLVARTDPALAMR